MTTTITETQSADAPVHAEEIDEHDRPTGRALCDLGDGEFVDGPLANSSWQITCEKCLAWHDEPTASASEYAHQICPPQDHQPAQPRRRSAKPGRFNTPARRAYTLRRLVERVNAGVVTVAQYLTEIGADPDTIRRYASQVGKRAKAAYAAKFGAEPERCGLAVVGRHLTRCFAYDRADAELLREAVASYPKTSHLLTIEA